MNYAIFTYRGDAECLDICVKQILKADSEAHVYIFNDGADPIVDFSCAKNVFLRYTWFPRKGNLNGLECIRGILMSMLSIPTPGPVIKVDADTLIMSTDLIKNSLASGKLAGGMQCAIPLAWSGVCYWLTRQAICDALHLLVTREFPTRGNYPYPEDVTISQIMFFLYGKSGVDLFEFNGGEHLIGVRSCDPQELPIYAKIAHDNRTAIHCGQTAFYEPLAKQYDESLRQAAARIMHAVLNEGKLP